MTETTLSAEAVAAWLEQHPEFVDDHPELLSRREFEQDSGTASLMEHRAQRLRQDNRQLQQTLESLTRVAEENERLLKRLLRLVLELASADSTELLIQRLDQGLRKEFRADEVRLLKCDTSDNDLPGALISELPDRQPEWLATLIENSVPVCGRLTQAKRTTVFGDAGAELGSVALVPLNPTWVLAIGAREQQRFQPDMGTLFLELLADALRFRLGLDTTEPALRQVQA